MRKPLLFPTFMYLIELSSFKTVIVSINYLKILEVDSPMTNIFRTSGTRAIDVVQL